MRFEDVSVEQMGKIKDHPNQSLNGMLVIVTMVDRFEIEARFVQTRGTWQKGDKITLNLKQFDPNIL